jgi:hypothetical protein
MRVTSFHVSTLFYAHAYYSNACLKFVFYCSKNFLTYVLKYLKQMFSLRSSIRLKNINRFKSIYYKQAIKSGENS